MTDGRGAAPGRPGLAQPARGRPLLWGVFGLLAQVAFMAGWLIAETWQGPRYSSIKYTISDLQAATAPHVWFPITCFAIGGIGTFCFAVFGLRPALAEAGKLAAHAPWMLAFSALALGNSFPLVPFRLADPGASAHAQLFSAGGMTDAIVSSAAFIVLILTPFPLWRRLAALPEWRRLKPVLLAARFLGPLCWTLLSVASIFERAQGLMERLLVTVCVLWVGALALNLLVVAHRPAARPFAPQTTKGAL